METWNDEIEQLNAGKIGQPYLYPRSMIQFLAVLHVKSFDYRALQGIMQALSKNIMLFPAISYSQICRRVNKLEVKFEIVEKNLVVAGDGSGEKSTKRGGWIREKWKVKKGWIKVVILGTTSGRIVDIRIGTETLNECSAVRGMIRSNHSRIKKVLLDGLHDCRQTFDLCEKYNIETAIKIRKNASTRARNSSRRKKEVIKYKAIGHENWVKEKGYGMRWPASEGIFSANKRIFGETVSATKKRNMYHEVKLKFWAYNQLLNL